MKQLFKSMGVSLATGIAFLFGISVASVALDVFYAEGQNETVHVRLPEGVTIEEHQKKPSDNFLIEGVITNATKQNWQSINVEVTIFAGDAKMNECDTDVKEIKANSTRQFRIQCYDVSGSGLPSNVRYEVATSHGWKISGT